jgi:hypothetical protein
MVLSWYAYERPRIDPQLIGAWRKGSQFLVFTEDAQLRLLSLSKGQLSSRGSFRYSADQGKLHIDVMDEEGWANEWVTYEMHVRSEDGALRLAELAPSTSFGGLLNKTGPGDWTRACVTIDKSQKGWEGYRPCVSEHQDEPESGSIFQMDQIQRGGWPEKDLKDDDQRR